MSEFNQENGDLLGLYLLLSEQVQEVVPEEVSTGRQAPGWWFSKPVQQSGGQ